MASKKVWLDRYYNTLRVQDTIIRRLYDKLKEKDRLKDTVIVLVGDHGEAFGQHANNWIHSRASYEENYQVPVVIYQPRLFLPREIRERTTHIDILPTLLDALGLKYNHDLLQGESVWQNAFQRKYIFLMGNEGTLSSISKDDIKLQISLKTGLCWAFNLALDPDENKKLSCSRYHEQRDTLLQYRQYQFELLRRYSQAGIQNKP